jgi:hypothetical protein
MAVFRGKLRAAIREACARGRLTVPSGQRRQQVEHVLNQLGRAKGNVHIRERYPYGQGVLLYLARYRRGGPMAPQRVLSWEREWVVLRYAARANTDGGQAPAQTMRVPLEQFLGRWRLHVPPPRAVRVRCGGLYAHTQGQALARCRPQVGQGAFEAPAPRDGPPVDEAWGEAPAERCPVWGQRLVCTALLPRAGVPPPSATGWEQVA